MKRIFITLLIITAAYIVLVQSNVLANWWPNKIGEHEVKISSKTDLVNLDISGASATVIPVQGKFLRAELVKGNGDLEVTNSGDKVTVKFKRKWLESFKFYNQSQIVIYLPENYKENLKITLGSGSVRNADFTSKKPLMLEELEINVGSGDVNLKHVNANVFRQNVSSGNAQHHSITTKKSIFNISSGNVTIKEFIGELDADVSSGNFDIQMAKLTGDIDLEVSSGKASITLPPAASFSLDGRVSSGRIKNSFPLTGLVEDAKTIKGAHGSAKHKIDIDVSSGWVDIR